MNYIFIAYYFDPYPGVGAKRISYWAKNLDLSGVNSKIVLTRFPDDKNSTDNFYNLKRLSYNTDSKVLWLIWSASNLLRLLRSSRAVVIITGGPFFPMALGLIVKLFRSKLVLDFRDPYARNPLHDVTFIKQKLKIFYEYIICLSADKIITTSLFSGKLITTKKSKLQYIDNGYDETILSRIKFTNIIIPNSIGYAGKISQKRDINGFLDKIKQDKKFSRFTLHYIGSDFNNIDIKHQDKVIPHGNQSYENTLKLLNQFEVLLLVYGGEEFESSTKIFDYIGLNKKILVYNHKGVYKGAVINILKEYNNYSIFNKDLKETPVKEKEIEIKKFSRSKGLLELKKILQDL